MNWIALLIFRAKTIAVMCGIPITVSWSLSDRRNLSVFLTSQTGERFIHVLRNLAMQNTQNAVYGKGELSYARGQQEMFGEICFLSAMSPQQVTQSGNALTDNSDEADTQEEEEDPSGLYGHGGSSIGT